MRKMLFITVATIFGSSALAARAEQTEEIIKAEAQGNVSPAAQEKTKPNPDEAGERMTLAPMGLGSVEQTPVLKHIAKNGAQIFDAGTAHGLRAVVARQREEFMILQVAPDGEAVVAGLQVDLSVAKLSSVAGTGQRLTELGTVHGMRGLFVRNGEQYQVFYATPDERSVIPGVMWDARGRNITREQVAPLPGVTPSVVIGNDNESGASKGVANAPKKTPIELAEQTSFGVTGSASAPRLFVFVDPLCGYSTKAMQQLQPFVAKGRVQAAIIPLSVLDYEDQGRSTTGALAMLSKSADQMVSAWSHGDLSGPASSDAEPKLRANMIAAEAIGLRGTPTVIWRKADGSEGRIDGLPEDWNAVIASMGGENHAARLPSTEGR
jgi:thiol:disulfide interchange protein DsbG